MKEKERKGKWFKRYGKKSNVRARQRDWMIMLGQGKERQNAFGAFSSTFEDFNKLKYANVTGKIFGDLK